MKGVFLGKDFLTVTKNEDEVWKLLKLQVFSIIMDFFATGRAVLEPDSVKQVGGRVEYILYQVDVCFLVV